MPRPGRIGLFAQSGAIGIALLSRLHRRGGGVTGVTGVSTFVSSGNRADVSGNDVLQYWYDDPDTDVVLMYLESIGNPRKFTRLARRTAAAKPLVVVRARGTAARSAGARRTGDAAAARDGVRAAAAGRRDPGGHDHRTGRRGAAAGPASRCPPGRGWRSSATPSRWAC